MKKFFCPNDIDKCFHTSQETSYYGFTSNKNIYINDLTTSAAGTTVEFADGDFCGWRIVVNSQYIYNKRIIFSVDTLNNAKCFFNVGQNISTASNEVSCYGGSVFSYDAD